MQKEFQNVVCDINVLIVLDYDCYAKLWIEITSSYIPELKFCCQDFLGIFFIWPVRKDCVSEEGLRV